MMLDFFRGKKEVVGVALFDIIGPIMVGPSSSHTAGAVRIGLMARTLLKEKPVKGQILLHGSFAKTGQGHGTDRAIVAGLLGMEPDDMRIPDSFEIAEKEGFRFSLGVTTLKDAHPNSVLISLEGESGRRVEVQCSSVGGGSIRVNRLDGVDVNFEGNSPTLIVHNEDEPGHISTVTFMLSSNHINIANMNVYRDRRGENAVMVVEMDQSVPEQLVHQMEAVEGIHKVIYFDGMKR